MRKAAAKELDTHMRALECLTPLRLLSGAWVIISVYSLGYHRFTEGCFGRPSDTRLRDLMAVTAQTLLKVFQSAYAYTMSGEISVLLALRWDAFAQRLERLFPSRPGSPARPSRLPAASLPISTAASGSARRGAGVRLLPFAAVGRRVQRAFGVVLLDARQRRGRHWERHVYARWCASYAMHKMLLRHGIDFDQLPPAQRQYVGLYWWS
jgi:hypothetical protein